MKPGARRTYNDDDFTKGGFGERLFELDLERQNANYLPFHMYTQDGAPLAIINGKKYIAPDFFLFRSDKKEIARWVEVKTKMSADYTRKEKRYDHGVDAYNVEQYMQVARASGKEVYLAVFELKPTLTLLIRKLSTLMNLEGTLAPRRGYTIRRDDEDQIKTPMIYFPRDGFKEVDPPNPGVLNENDYDNKEVKRIIIEGRSTLKQGELFNA
jgi:hypothetical protein